MKLVFRSILLLLFALLFVNAQANKKLNLKYEQFKLANGLDVILHQDHSDPICAVAIQYHVGSNREETGKTGFAHLFEHMMFQASQNIPQDHFFKKIQDAGGTLNGGTSNDGTVYFEVVPKNALEMVLWMEADRMGYLLPTITVESFKNQQDVVQNEKRQSVDNNPYGYVENMTSSLLYPAGHPYSWTVIGEMADLRNATLKDVHGFFKNWYGPNNATLVIAGDFDLKQAKALVEKYFGDVKKYRDIQDMQPKLVTLAASKRAYYEDNFAKSPEFNLLFPTVNMHSKESYALDFLGKLLAGSKKSPFYKVIVEEKKLAPKVQCFQNGLEVAGDFDIAIRTFPNVSLKDVEAAVNEAFLRFEKEGFSDKDIERIKASTEIDLYNSISSVLGKAFTLARYNEYYGSPEYINKDIEITLSITKDDIINAYNKYIKGKNYLLACVVPKGQVNLLPENVTLFDVKEEKLNEMVANTTKDEKVEIENLPSKFDRSKEPVKGNDPLLQLPKVWQNELKNKIKVAGIEQKELPLVQLQLTIPCGILKEESGKAGSAYILSQMFLEGTKNKTAIQLEEAIDDLGSKIFVNASPEGITFTVNCLKAKYQETVKLLEEIILEPAFNNAEFERIKAETLERIKRNQTNANSIAANVFNKLVYGKGNILSNSIYGAESTVKTLTVEDIKNYYNNNIAPDLAYLSVAGALNKNEAVKAFSNLEKLWTVKNVKPAVFTAPLPQSEAKVYFVDYPGAKQSVIHIGSIGLKYNDPDYYKAFVMNQYLGGSFNSVVNLILREEKGFTYGARTAFSGFTYPGTFLASSSVMSTATFESVKIFKDEITKYREGISADNLSFTKNSLLKSNARAYETLGALVGMLNSIQKYSLPVDFVKAQENIIKNMNGDEHKSVAQKYLQPDKMVYVVVGDATTQLEKLNELGLGKPVLVDRDGNVIAK